MASVELKNVRKVYPISKRRGKKRSEKTTLQITEEGVVAVQDFTLEIKDREFIVLVGPSGCGKSTTLRMVAGLEEITSGEIYIDGKLVNGVQPQHRNIAMVFQNYALYPHMTVFENIAFPLRMQKLPKGEIAEKVKEAAKILDIEELLERKPKELSGGQRQRVAIGRAIVREPKVLLMDEPLSNLDAKLRNQMRSELIKLRQKINTTFLYVTHDQTEAMTLGDRIVVMKDGVVQQVGTPEEVYGQPVNAFVAGFIGTPQMNFLKGVLRDQTLEIEGNSWKLPDRFRHDGHNAVPVLVGVRPDDLKLQQGTGIPVRVEVVEMTGNALHLHVSFQGEELILILSTKEVQGDLQTAFTPGDMLFLGFDPAAIHMFDENGNRI